MSQHYAVLAVVNADPSLPPATVPGPAMDVQQV